jgi:hypothetical protein
MCCNFRPPNPSPSCGGASISSACGVAADWARPDEVRRGVAGRAVTRSWLELLRTLGREPPLLAWADSWAATNGTTASTLVAAATRAPAQRLAGHGTSSVRIRRWIHGDPGGAAVRKLSDEQVRRKAVRQLEGLGYQVTITPWQGA